jgi:hypothetical protein
MFLLPFNCTRVSGCNLMCALCGPIKAAKLTSTWAVYTRVVTWGRKLAQSTKYHSGSVRYFFRLIGLIADI